MDKNDLLGHLIALVQLLCLYGRKERKKFICSYALYYKSEIELGNLISKCLNVFLENHAI